MNVWEQVKKLLEANPAELVSLFKARRVGDKYLIPFTALPWVTVIGLSSSFRLIDGDRVLTASIKVSVGGQGRVIVGFLSSSGPIYGALVGERQGFRCIKVSLSIPYGLRVVRGDLIFEPKVAYVYTAGPNIESFTLPQCSGLNLGSESTDSIVLFMLNTHAFNAFVEIQNLKVQYLPLNLIYKSNFSNLNYGVR